MKRKICNFRKRDFQFAKQESVWNSTVRKDERVRLQTSKPSKKIIHNRKTAKKKKKFDQNRKPHAKQSKPINVHIPVLKTLINPIRCWQLEHTEASRLFEISGGAYYGRLDWRENGIQIGQSENFIGNQIHSPLDRCFWRKPKTKC